MSVDLLYGRRGDTRAVLPFLAQQGKFNNNNEEFFEDEVVLVRGGDRDVDMTEDSDSCDSMSVAAAEANGRSSFKTNNSSSDSSSFSDLDFIAGADKGKRRSDRYDSSESSDSGVATLSPSTSEELISAYSPCDFSSEPSDASSCISGSPLSTSPTRDIRDVASFVPEVEQSSSSSTSSSSSAMTAVSSVLDVTQMTSSTSKINVTNFISFQIPKAQSSSTSTRGFASPVKILEPSSKGGGGGLTKGNRSPYSCDSTSTKKIHNIFAALKYKPDEVMPDLTAEFQPVVKVPNLRGAKSFILQSDGQRNKLIILSVPPKQQSTATSPNINNNNNNSTTNKNNKTTIIDDDSRTSPVRKKPRIDLDPTIIPLSISLTKSGKILESKSSLQQQKILPESSSLKPLFYSGPKKTDNSIEVSQRVTGTELHCPLPLSQSLPPNHHHHNNHSSLPPPLLESLELESKISLPPESLLPLYNSSSCSTSSSSSNAPPHLNSIVVEDDDSSNSSSKLSNSSSSSSSIPSSSSSSLVGQIFLTLSNKPCAQKSSSSPLPFSSSSSSTCSMSSTTSSFSCSSSSSSSFTTEVSRKRKLQQNGSNVSIQSSATTTSTSSSTSPIRSEASTEFRSILSLSTSSCTKNSQHPLFTSKTNDRLITTTHASSKCEPAGPLCLWKDCPSASDANLNILEHIQTAHVAPQLNKEAYICLWEGCKVFNKKSCSFSWLERHVLSHGGNKPFKCIIPGCGL